MSLPLASSFINPEDLMKQITVAPGAIVADFGCGSGYFSVSFARAVGKEGKVIALDILPSALEAVASRAKLAGLPQLTVKRANLEKEGGSGLPAESVDWVIAKDILFQNKDRETIFREVYRVMRPGALAVLMEWDNKDASVGPELALRIGKEEVSALARSVGLSLKQELFGGDFHYAFLLEK